MENAAKQAASVLVGAISVFCSTAAYSQLPQQTVAPYKIIAPIPGGGADGLWDYATIDVDARRLYLAQEGVTVLDLDSGKVTPHFVKGRTFQGLGMSHQVLPINGGTTLAVTDAGTNSVDFFDPRSGAPMSSASTRWSRSAI